jgi:uncharacterized phage protein (TIGR02218 family)
MTRALSAELLAHFAGDCTTLSMCWKIARRDAVTLGFTDADKDIVFSGVTYIARSGFAATTAAVRDDFSVSSVDAQGIIDNEIITEADLYNRKYEDAGVEIFVVNRLDLTQGRLMIFAGTVGQITLRGGNYLAELRGLAHKLQNPIGRIITPICDARLGDTRCGASLTAFAFSGTITAIITQKYSFKASGLIKPLRYFERGLVTFTGGTNAGITYDVRTSLADGTIILAAPLFYDAANGDTFSAVAGCDGTKQSCKTKFNNIENFRGFPEVPGMDKLMQTGSPEAS